VDGLHQPVWIGEPALFFRLSRAGKRHGLQRERSDVVRAQPQRRLERRQGVFGLLQPERTIGDGSQRVQIARIELRRLP
jgi:hypothetical protein